MLHEISWTVAAITYSSKRDSRGAERGTSYIMRKDECRRSIINKGWNRGRHACFRIEDPWGKRSRRYELVLLWLSPFAISASHLPLHRAHHPEFTTLTILAGRIACIIISTTTLIFFLDTLEEFINMAQREHSELYPARFLAESAHPEKTSNPPDLLILNQPIAHFTPFSRLWKHTGYRICADGGANRLYDMLKDDLIAQREQYVSKYVIYSVNTGR